MAYLDHNATSPLRPRVRAAMLEALDRTGNASSVHGPGRAARAVVEAAREKVAALAGVVPGQVVFTSGGSEANALALRGAVQGAAAAEDRLTRMFLSAVEHESVRANAYALAEQVPGLKVAEFAVTEDGLVDLPALRLQLMQGKGRALVAVMAANNETGVIQPIAEIIAVVRRELEDALILVDAVQAAGRIPLTAGADFVTLSAHKLGGPQGVGALILGETAPFAPLMVGAQENFRRGGTENVAAIAGFGAAADEPFGHLAALRDRFEAGLKTLVADAVVFGERAPRLANTSNFAIPGLAAETALIALDLDGIAISSGAACSSGKVRVSHVLSAMGVPEELARCGLRLSLGWSNTEADIGAALEALARLIARRTALGREAA